MFTNLEDLKNFVLWCKVEKIQRFKLGDVEVELSGLALVEDLAGPKGAGEEKNSSKTLTDDDDMSPEEYERLLYHSTGN